jgi:oligopeptide/dipeptide ABC transporter ATP-binding protein
MDNILRVENLETHFFTYAGIIKAVDNVSFELADGEVLGLVGESGSGKSMTCRSILRLIPESAKIVGGKIYYKNEDILSWPENKLIHYRGEQVAMILQEPMTALNPVVTIGNQIEETILQHENISSGEARKKVIELIRMVGIPVPEQRIKEYPHQFSGGMRQRVMIAIALACRPKILLADEPTTALDVTIQDQIIRLIRDLQKQIGMSVVWVTHDLGVVAQLCDRVAVMYAGRIVEMAKVIELYENSRHPYTVGLLESVPAGGDRYENRLIPIPGTPPNLANLPPGCAFKPRCRFATDKCNDPIIPLVEVIPNHYTACVRYKEIWR